MNKRTYLLILVIVLLASTIFIIVSQKDGDNDLVLNQDTQSNCQEIDKSLQEIGSRGRYHSFASVIWDSKLQSCVSVETYSNGLEGVEVVDGNLIPPAGYQVEFMPITSADNIEGEIIYTKNYELATEEEYYNTMIYTEFKNQAIQDFLNRTE